MHILWVTEYARMVGGLEGYILNTVRHLKKRGVRSTLLYEAAVGFDEGFLAPFDAAFPMKDVRAQAQAINADVTYIHQLQDTSLLEQLPHPKLAFIHDYRFFCLRQTKLTTIKREPCTRPTGAHCYPCLGFINKQKDVCENTTGLTLKRLGTLEQEQNRFATLDGCIVGSEFMRSHLEAHGLANLIHLPLYAEPAPDVHEERQSNLLLFAGQLIPSKGLDVLLEALKTVRTPCELVVAGDGPLKESYQAQAGSNVRFLGRLSQEELLRWQAKASCVVHPAKWPETFGLVGPEAMRLKTPIIASDIGAIPEWKEGLFVPHSDPKRLSIAIDRVLQDSELREQMGQKGYERYLSHYQPEQHIDGLLEIFKKLTGPKRLTPYGSPEFERSCWELLERITAKVKEHVPASKIRALVLIGGYGRGEGGVQRIDGQERLVNDLDLLLITKGNLSLPHDLLQEFEKEAGCVVELATVSETKLTYGPHLLLYYEMQQGCQVLIGDKEWIAQLPHSRVSKVDPFDVRTMRMNRLTLLLLNRNGAPEEAHSRHRAKAIIGVGDAALFFSGHYHWSYTEKAKRIEKSGLSPKFCEAYRAAIEWRFAPEGEFEGLDNLESYIPESMERSLKNSLKVGWLSWRRWVQRLRALLRPPRRLLGKSIRAKLGYLLATPIERLSHEILDVSDERAFLRQWSKVTGEPFDG